MPLAHLSALDLRQISYLAQEKGALAMTSVIVVCFSVAIAAAIAALVHQFRQRRALQALLIRLLRKRREDE